MVKAKKGIGQSARAPILSPIVALTHPGGRNPGIVLPPLWFPNITGFEVVPAELPKMGDRQGIDAAVYKMSRSVFDHFTNAFKQGEHPLLVGGDHSLAIGSIAAAAKFHKNLGLVWIDAHADFNTPETSTSGNPHGMPLAVSCGLGSDLFRSLFTRFVNPKNVVLIAARDIDELEAGLLAQQHIELVTVEKARALGPQGLARFVSDKLGHLPVHLSFDFDALDAESFLATGTPVKNGLKIEETKELFGCFRKERLKIVSSDWVEFDPRHATADSCAQTALDLFSVVYGEAPRYHLRHPIAS